MNWADIAFDLGLSALFTKLKDLAKNEKERRKQKNVMLKIYRAIGAAYANDEDFTGAK